MKNEGSGWHRESRRHSEAAVKGKRKQIIYPEQEITKKSIDTIRYLDKEMKKGEKKEIRGEYYGSIAVEDIYMLNRKKGIPDSETNWALNYFKAIGSVVEHRPGLYKYKGGLL